MIILMRRFLPIPERFGNLAHRKEEKLHLFTTQQSEHNKMRIGPVEDPLQDLLQELLLLSQILMLLLFKMLLFLPFKMLFLPMLQIHMLPFKMLFLPLPQILMLAFLLFHLLLTSEELFQLICLPFVLMDLLS